MNTVNPLTTPLTGRQHSPASDQGNGASSDQRRGTSSGQRQTTLVFSRNGGIISRLVRFFTRSDWSHVDLYDPSTQTVIGAMPPSGVREISLSDLLATSSHVVAVTYTGICPKKLLAYARSKIGASYDWRALAGFVTKSMLDNPAKYFCSELVAKAFAAGGCPIVIDEDHIKATPDSVYGLAGFGKLNIKREVLLWQSAL